MMKTISRMLTIVFLAILFGCKDDSDPSGASLTGSWRVQSKETFDCTIASENNELSCGTYAFCYTITFNSDQTFELERTSDGSYLGVGDFIYAQGHLTLTFTHNPAGFVDTQGAEAVINGNTLTTTEEGSSCTVRMTYEKL